MKLLLLTILSLNTISAFASLNIKESITIKATGDIIRFQGEMQLIDTNDKEHTLVCSYSMNTGNELVFSAISGSFGVLKKDHGSLSISSKDECLELSKLLHAEIEKGNTVTITGSNEKNIEITINK